MGSFAEYARWVLEPELPVEPTPARSSYFVCSVQRSGTWLLAGLLDSQANQVLANAKSAELEKKMRQKQKQKQKQTGSSSKSGSYSKKI